MPIRARIVQHPGLELYCILTWARATKVLDLPLWSELRRRVPVEWLLEHILQLQNLIRIRACESLQWQPSVGQALRR